MNSTINVPSGPRRILVVDDDPGTRQLIVRALRLQGIECDTAAHGVEALRMVERSPYDLVVTDLRMPKLNGEALAADLLGRDDPPRVVVVTGVVDRRLARKLLAQGVEGIAFKPVNFAKLAARLKRILDEKPARNSAGSEAKQV